MNDSDHRFPSPRLTRAGLLIGVPIAVIAAVHQGYAQLNDAGCCSESDLHELVSVARFELDDALDLYPTDPKTGGPWVMWKGTRYAHVMVPVAAMPKQPAPPNAK